MERAKGVDAAAETREQAQPEIPHLIAHALENESPIGGNNGGGLLIEDVPGQIRRGALIERVGGGEHRDGTRATQGQDLARQGADPFRILHRARGAIGFPKRHASSKPGSRGDDHPVALDLVDTPRRGAQHDDVAHPALEDHLFIEFPNPA